MRNLPVIFSGSGALGIRGALAFAQLLLAPLVVAQAPPAAPASIGAIVDYKDREPGNAKLTLEYSYEAASSRLILIVRGVEMNAGAAANPAKTVGGQLAVKGNQIQIAPEEIYHKAGPVESLRVYSLRYIIPKVAPGIYRLLHDDSKTEGSDQAIDISLDLRKPVKKTLVIDAKQLGVVSPPPPPPPPAPKIEVPDKP